MTTLSPGQAQQIANLGACLDTMAASSGPQDFDFNPFFVAAYNKMADIAALPHAPPGTIITAGAGAAMDWANKASAAGVMTQQQFADYIGRALDELTASITGG